MMIQYEIILFAVVTIIGGILIARRLHIRRQALNLSERLKLWDEQLSGFEPATVHKSKAVLDQTMFPASNAVGSRIELLINQSGVDMTVSTFVATATLLLIAPLILGLLFDWHMLACLVAGLVLAIAPVFLLLAKRSARRTKFVNQLPDAIDLMISILRSGHSIPQAVKTVGDESPSPCGDEFKEVIQRMNLGQPLAKALFYSCEKYQSVELDLLRRAVSIQSEVGGSLAELLDKTNSTLRQRLKLVRHVGVLTTQSKMTAVVVGLLPVFMAIGLQFLSPNYLTPLLDTQLGNILLLVAVVLQIFGIVLMRKMATVKV
ncbi:MAG: type II secretion system F family protein [Candidatus Melainabacteria bacterium]|nr:type II secretion system F family protein [Candidatus Melainabacteria bacterium]